MKRKERKTNSKFQIIYEYVPSPDGEKRLAEAYGMLFEKVEKMLADERVNKKNSKAKNTL